MKTTIAILLSMIFGAPALAATFVYVSNADDGEIRTYTLQADGSLKPGQTTKAEKIVMPMVVTPDKRFLIAAVRSKPYQAYSYAIDQKTGDLSLVGTGALAESFPYISLDRAGRFLLGASYGANLVSVNPVGADGRVGAPKLGWGHSTWQASVTAADRAKAKTLVLFHHEPIRDDAGMDALLREVKRHLPTLLAVGASAGSLSSRPQP